MSTRPKVVIVGGGVAGLTAAHELIERDFDVEVYERRLHCGGKAASVRVDIPPSLRSVPGEHGFRFFPGWYRHIPNTMGRIPTDRRRELGEHRTVLDHLVNVPSNLLVTYNRDPIPVVLHAPRSTDQAQKLLRFVVDVQKMGLTIDEAVFFLTKLVEFLSVPDDVRRQQYDRIAWTDFIDAEKRTAAFRLLASNTRSLVAAKPEEASAYTIATMAIRTLLETSTTLDRVLDGPTSEVWIEPWVKHLKHQGVKFHLGYDLDAIAFDGTGPGIASLRFAPVDSRYVASSKDGTMPDHEYNEWCRLRVPSERSLPGTPAGDWPSNIRRHSAKFVSEVKADYFLFAVPIEQMAYYVNRSTMMTHYSPSLRRLVRLSGSVDWMAGIQFYLRYPLNVEAGHIVCADSEWALTAIEQTQLWRDANVPRDVQSILSVDVSQWNKKGRFNKKEAFRCSKSEIAEEVWKQLEASFNRTGGRQLLQESMLFTGELKGSFHIDASIVERYDRKKQASYDRSQALRLSAAELLADGNADRRHPLRVRRARRNQHRASPRQSSGIADPQATGSFGRDPEHVPRRGLREYGNEPGMHGGGERGGARGGERHLGSSRFQARPLPDLGVRGQHRPLHLGDRDANADDAGGS